jgi:hypothetical protein
LFSNTARAHELGRTRDWVVIYFSSRNGDEAQRTVVTEARGESRRPARRPRPRGGVSRLPACGAETP